MLTFLIKFLDFLLIYKMNLLHSFTLISSPFYMHRDKLVFSRFKIFITITKSKIKKIKNSLHHIKVTIIDYLYNKYFGKISAFYFLTSLSQL